MARKNRIDIVLFTRYRTESLPEAIFSRMKQVFEDKCTEIGCRLLRFKIESEYVQLRIKKSDEFDNEELIAIFKGIEDNAWSNIQSFWGNHYAFVSKIKAS